MAATTCFVGDGVVDAHGVAGLTGEDDNETGLTGDDGAAVGGHLLPGDAADWGSLACRDAATSAEAGCSAEVLAGLATMDARMLAVGAGAS